jgi:hypothetical protein
MLSASRKPLPLSLGVQERILEGMKAKGEDVGELDLLQIVRDAYCVPYGEEEVVLHLFTLLGDVKEWLLSLSASPSSPQQGGKKGFGDLFWKWAGSLTVEQRCLFLADFDIAKAEDLYWRTPADQVGWAITSKVEQVWTMAFTRFEAAVLAAGGEFKQEGGPIASRPVKADEGSARSLGMAFMDPGILKKYQMN